MGHTRGEIHCGTQDLTIRTSGHVRSPHTGRTWGQGLRVLKGPPTPIKGASVTRPPCGVGRQGPLDACPRPPLYRGLSMCVRTLHWEDLKHLSARPAASPPRERLRCGESSVQIKCPSTSLLRGLPAPLRTEIINPVPTAHCWPRLTCPCTPGANTILTEEAPIGTGFVLPREGHRHGVNSASS